MIFNCVRGGAGGGGADGWDLRLTFLGPDSHFKTGEGLRTGV